MSEKITNSIKLAVSTSCPKAIKSLINLGVDKIYVGIKDFSICFNSYLNLEQLKIICNHKNKTKISVCLNKIYQENEINDLINLISDLKEIQIDEISFHDFAVLQIIYELNIKIALHYNPETLITNFGQFNFYEKNNINSITVAKELTFNELKNICKNKQSLNVEIQCHGFCLIMYSSWPMISNFNLYLKHKNEQKINNNKLVVKEETRETPCIIIQENDDTFMYSGFILCLYELIDKLKEIGIDYLFINGVLKSDQWLLSVAKIYLDAIKGINKNNLVVLEKLENKYKLSKSFLGPINEMLYLKRDKEN